MKRLAIAVVVMKLMMPGFVYAVIAGGEVKQMPLDTMHHSTRSAHTCMRTIHGEEYTQAFCHVWDQQPTTTTTENKTVVTQLMQSSTHVMVQKASKVVTAERQQ